MTVKLENFPKIEVKIKRLFDDYLKPLPRHGFNMAYKKQLTEESLF